MKELSTKPAPWWQCWRWIAASVAALGLASVGAALLPPPEEAVAIHGEVSIARSPQEVFDFVSTPGNWPQWHPSSLGVTGATDHPLLVGEQVTEDFIVAGRRGRAMWTVTAREAPWRWQIEGHGTQGGQAWITYTLSRQGNATRFQRDMRYRMPNLLAALIDPVLTRGKIAEESARAVSQLQRVLESGSAPGRP